MDEISTDPIQYRGLGKSSSHRKLHDINKTLKTETQL